MGVRHIEYQSAPKVGSPEWLAAKFNFDNERTNLFRHNHVGTDLAYRYLHRELLTLCTELASGRDAMAVQTSTEYEIRKQSDGSLQVYLVKDLEKLGDQVKSFLNFDQLSSAINQGLMQGIEALSELEVGEGIVTLSPADLYATEFDSVNDVINPMVVTSTSEEASEKRVRVTGWYIFANRALDDESRQFLHNLLSFDLSQVTQPQNPFLLHTQSRSSEYTDKAEIYVSQPRKTRFSFVKQNSHQVIDDWSIFPWVERLQELFSQTFPDKQELFSHLDYQKELRHTAEVLVSTHIGGLMSLLQQGEYSQFFVLLSSIVRNGQNQYAHLLEEDPEDYMNLYDQGKIMVADGHPMDPGANLELFWDAQADDWKGGTRCEASIGDKVCTNPGHRGKTSVAKRYESQCIDCIKEKRLMVA